MKGDSGINIFWFRRDFRLNDNHGLYKALCSDVPVLPIFIFDKNILDALPRNDARVSFIHDRINQLKGLFQERGSDLSVFHGNPLRLWQQIIQDYPVKAVYTNRDYEPYAKSRDLEIKNMLANHDIAFHDFKDHVIYENSEIRSKQDTTYTVFTPFKKTWLAKFKEDYGPTKFPSYPSEQHLSTLLKITKKPLISLKDLGFNGTDIKFPPAEVANGVIRQYEQKRNFPAIKDSTSKLGVHFRFGTLSIREKARKSSVLSETYLSELIWRDFYSQILDAFPHVVGRAFKAQYDRIEWVNDMDQFAQWTQGKTGYPIVDAGMRELNTTGFMHNRVRMIVASFLTKHLLIDWRLGEQYFAEKLLDFDLASNNGGWQWAAGSGTDAAPYFRIFNPTSQQQKFDPDRSYIKRWVAEIDTSSYPNPIIDHAYARERCLITYKRALA